MWLPYIAICVCGIARARSLRRRHQFGRVSRARLAGHQVLSRPCVSRECARVHSLSPTCVPEVRERKKNCCSDVQSDADNIFSC